MIDKRPAQHEVRDDQNRRGTAGVAVPQRAARRRSPVRVLGSILGWLFAAMLFVHVAAGAAFFALRGTNPLITALQVQRRVEAWAVGKPYVMREMVVPMSRISRHLAHAVIAAEDGGFFAHGGIDWDELKNAVEENETRRRWRGGSTITQQLVKNLFFGTRARWLTKPFEFTLAPIADAILGKARTLELYLNVVEWGPGVYGAEAAARFHYRTGAARLSRGQSARLAAILPSPRTRRPRAMNRYARIILTRMQGRGW